MAINRLRTETVAVDVGLLSDMPENPPHSSSDASGSSPATTLHASPSFTPTPKPGGADTVSTLLSLPRCEAGLIHPAEGHLLNSSGTKLSALCLTCAKGVLAEYRKKFSPEEQAQMNLSLWTFERFETEIEEEKEEKESTPLADSISLKDLDESIRSLLSSLVSSYRSTAKKISSLQDDQINTKEEIEEICLKLASKRIISPDWSTTRTRKSTSSFNKTKAITLCLERDIDPIDFLDILSLATEKKKGKEFVMISDPEKKGKADRKEKEKHT